MHAVSSTSGELIVLAWRMGNEVSGEEEVVVGVRLRSQNPDHLWTITHRDEEEDEENAEEVCVFTHVRGKDAQAQLCQAGVDVSC